ncbi:MAG: hypothetical protein U9R25_11995 [Chloroflexota bacterium]|nr:hypothetical protein [Chloroflexota bacterium]
MEMQSHEPSNAVFLNGHFLGYLPVKDWVYAWDSASFPVLSSLLQPGYNELMVRSGSGAPKSQGSISRWDEVLFRNVYLSH